MDDLWRLRLAALCNFLQESAVAHAQALGMGRDALLAINLTWVLSRFHVRVAAYPRWGQDLTVETWPSAVSGQFALREFRHVNFVKTIELGLEAVPGPVWEKRRVSDLEIAFRSEIVLGDTIIARAGFLSEEEPLRLGHSLVRERDGRETARLTTTWPAGS